MSGDDHHGDVARDLLERAEYIANADRWIGDRDADVRAVLARAQVHATLAVAERLRTLTGVRLHGDAVSAAVIVAPTDAQLAYLADLCEQRGLGPPAAIYSRADASDCIAAILRGQYSPLDFAAPSTSPTHDDADYYDGEPFANGESAYDPAPDLLDAPDYGSVPF